MLELLIWIFAAAVTLPLIIATATLVRMGNKTTHTSTERSLTGPTRIGEHA